MRVPDWNISRDINIGSRNVQNIWNFSTVHLSLFPPQRLPPPPRAPAPPSGDTFAPPPFAERAIACTQAEISTLGNGTFRPNIWSFPTVHFSLFPPAVYRRQPSTCTPVQPHLR